MSPTRKLKATRGSKVTSSRKPRAPVETACLGCGAEHPKHPMVAVVKAPAGRSFIGRPVCEACWQDPAHRTTPIKGHFFPRADAPVAIARAGSSTIGRV